MLYFLLLLILLNSRSGQSCDDRILFRMGNAPVGGATPRIIGNPKERNVWTTSTVLQKNSAGTITGLSEPIQILLNPDFSNLPSSTPDSSQRPLCGFVAGLYNVKTGETTLGIAEIGTWATVHRYLYNAVGGEKWAKEEDIVGFGFFLDTRTGKINLHPQNSFNSGQFNPTHAGGAWLGSDVELATKAITAAVENHSLKIQPYKPQSGDVKFPSEILNLVTKPPRSAKRSLIPGLNTSGNKQADSEEEAYPKVQGRIGTKGGKETNKGASGGKTDTAALDQIAGDYRKKFKLNEKKADDFREELGRRVENHKKYDAEGKPSGKISYEKIKTLAKEIWEEQ